LHLEYKKASRHTYLVPIKNNNGFILWINTIIYIRNNFPIRGIDFSFFHDFSIWFPNCSASVVFFVLFYWVIQTRCLRDSVVYQKYMMQYDSGYKAHIWLHNSGYVSQDEITSFDHRGSIFVWSLKAFNFDWYSVYYNEPPNKYRNYVH
jgi:hypothetical protein